MGIRFKIADAFTIESQAGQLGVLHSMFRREPCAAVPPLQGPVRGAPLRGQVSSASLIQTLIQPAPNSTSTATLRGQPPLGGWPELSHGVLPLLGLRRRSRGRARQLLKRRTHAAKSNVHGLIPPQSALTLHWGARVD